MLIHTNTFIHSRCWYEFKIVTLFYNHFLSFRFIIFISSILSSVRILILPFSLLFHQTLHISLYYTSIHSLSHSSSQLYPHFSTPKSHSTLHTHARPPLPRVRATTWSGPHGIHSWVPPTRRWQRGGIFLRLRRLSHHWTHQQGYLSVGECLFVCVDAWKS